MSFTLQHGKLMYWSSCGNKKAPRPWFDRAKKDIMVPQRYAWTDLCWDEVSHKPDLLIWLSRGRFQNGGEKHVNIAQEYVQTEAAAMLTSTDKLPREAPSTSYLLCRLLAKAFADNKTHRISLTESRFLSFIWISYPMLFVWNGWKQSPVPKFHQPRPDLAVSGPLARRRRDPYLTNFPFCFVTCHRRFSVVNDHINFSVIRGDKPLPTLQYGERETGR